MRSLALRIADADKLLSPGAVLHASAVRRYLEPEDATRFPFQRDRDRILHTQAFRRLKHKTQVFVAGHGDHYRTRITHTLEVAQISRDIARTLGLNEDLAEAIALAHDLGHTPFGHAGEEALDACLRPLGLHFEHNEQSLRIVTEIETRSEQYPGLNLSTAILDGLQKHRTPHDVPRGGEGGLSLEAQVVNLADEIAYTAHDTDDGLRADLLDVSLLRSTTLGSQAIEHAASRGTEIRGALVDLLVQSLYRETEHRIAHPVAGGMPTVAFEPLMFDALASLRALLWDRLYRSPSVLAQAERGKTVVRDLFARYIDAPPPKVLERVTNGVPLAAAVRDYIAGMTDGFALRAWGGGR